MNVWGPMENGFSSIPNFPATTFDSMPTNGVFDPTAFDAGFHPSVLNSLDAIDMNGAAAHPPPIDLSPGSDLSHHSIHSHNSHTQAQHPVTEEENGSEHSSNWPVFPQSHAPHATSDVPFQPSPSMSHSYESDNSSRAAVSMRHYSESLSRAYGSSISPYSATNAMVTVTNRNMISDNLMKIYHDVLEHALSCWISEETCPYKITPNAPKVNGVTWLSDGFEKLNILDHYEPSYQENRVYRRVMKLDRVAQKNKLIQLTKSEDRAASKALNLAIMAFATQWAQSSSRGRERFPSSLHALENGRNDADEMSEDFDRTLQRTFWAQAKRALADASDLECFRVVCADLIFGLAQKPMEEDDSSYESSYGMFDGGFDVASSVSSGSSGDQSVASQISEIIAKEGPPVFMERAARKMHALKFQVEAREAGVLDGSKSSLGLEKSRKGEILSPEDRDTVGLVYWMTVMFDTVSSSMNGRPVVVSDEECQHDPSYHENLEHEAKVEFQLHDARWWEEVVARDSIEGGIRFPCSYELATKGVIAAAPTKVLLFRHVSYLQNIVRSKRRGEPVEKIILNAMAVYRHWRVNYSAFFRDLVDHYELVPGYIQSWFVCVAAHFHLAALLMIDLVELVDENNLGIEYASQVRISTNVVARLRKDSAGVLSDLARVSTAARAGDVPGANVSELHFAIVEGSILTEPWTMILLRGFTKAAMITLTEAEDIVRGNPTSIQDPARLMDAVKRCEDCTKALYCLGKKSDMARSIAVVLTGALSPFLMRSPMNIITA